MSKKAKMPAPGKVGRPQRPTAKPQHKPNKTTKVQPKNPTVRTAKGASKPSKTLDKKAQLKAREAEKKAREADKKAQVKAREAEKRAREAEKKAREADKKAQLKAREAEKKAREAEKKARTKEAERKKQEAERLKQALEAQKAREAEKSRREAEKLMAREAERKAAEAEKQRRAAEREEARVAKEQERLKLKAQREAEREEARRLKEEERAKREAEREAYRKAKEAEREKIRAAKEAARRALEGRIAEASRNANKLGGGRSSTTRIYSPKAIPDQSGTTRRGLGTPTLMGVAPVLTTPHATVPGSSPPAPQDTFVPTSDLPSSAPPRGDDLGANPQPIATEGGHTDEEAAHAAAERSHHLAAENIEERYRAIDERLKHVPDSLRRDYQEQIDMSWIHHDSALEGVVYTFQELKTALDPSNPVITDSSLQPVIDEIRRHKAAIDLVRDLGERKRAPITVDTIKKIFVTLHPEEGDIKTVKYRRDIPQHRLYFHEYAHPEKITHKVRQVVEWLNGPEPKKLRSPIRVAARVHYELLRAFPFQTDSGKVGRFVMNLILMRSGHPPAIIHSTERQRYYEALKGALPVLVQMVTESILNALSSIEKLLDDHDAKSRA